MARGVVKVWRFEERKASEGCGSSADIIGV